MGLLSWINGTPDPERSTDWGYVADAHAEKAVQAKNRGDAAKAAHHCRQQKQAVSKAREQGQWWQHA